MLPKPTTHILLLLQNRERLATGGSSHGCAARCAGIKAQNSIIAGAEVADT